MLLEDKQLAAAKLKVADLTYPEEARDNAYSLCGAYIGSVTGLQYAVLLEQEDIALAIADATLSHDIDLTCGGQNTALHLACLLGDKPLVQALLERGAATDLKNSKGYTPVALCSNPEGMSAGLEVGTIII